MNAIDLFCGCGGMSQGLINSGLNIIAGIDHWNIAIESYLKNFNHLAICEDLKTLTPNIFDAKYLNKEKIDIIVGGPPCQGFSIAGRRNVKDERNTLFNQYYNYVDYFKPKAFIMENVVGILSMKDEKGEKVINKIMSLFSVYYNCNISVLNASDFEVPQKRKRVFIIGIRKDLNIFPQSINGKNEIIPVKTILEDNVDRKYFLSEKAIKGIYERKEKMKVKGYGFGAQFLDLDKPSNTIPARYWKDGYDALVRYDDENIRRLTINELKKIQTFPEDFILAGSKKDQIIQIGNSVPCNLSYHVSNHVVNSL